MALVLGAAFAAVGAFATGCAETGEDAWFQSLPPETARSPDDYVIGSGDLVSIRVLGHEDMTVRQRVRGDGKIAMFLIGELEARGKKPAALKAELEGRLKEFIVAPSVMVNVDEAQPTAVVILGEVTRPGALQLDQDTRLSRALAMAGGLTEFASRSGIYVVRQAPAHMRVRFQYKDVLRNAGGAGDFLLHQGDLVEVE